MGSHLAPSLSYPLTVLTVLILRFRFCFQNTCSKNDKIFVMAPQQQTQVESTDESVPERKSGAERMEEHNQKCGCVSHYLRHGKHQNGLTKNQQRTVRVQAKNYVLDENSEYKFN